jgi:hypothetical protein
MKSNRSIDNNSDGKKEDSRKIEKENSNSKEKEHHHSESSYHSDNKDHDTPH